MNIVTLENLEALVGTDCEPSAWINISQQRINEFADTTEDHQFIHVDPEAAKNTPFGGPIAHGFLTLSLLSKMAADFGVFVEGAVMAINYGFNKIRFLAPVPAGSDVRGAAKIQSIVKKPNGQVVITYEVTVEIKGSDKPALVAEWISMLAMG